MLRAEQMPGDVITMWSKVQVVDLANAARSNYELVYPFEADIVAGKVSVLAPLDTAMLGFLGRSAVSCAAESTGPRRRQTCIAYQEGSR